MLTFVVFLQLSIVVVGALSVLGNGVLFFIVRSKLDAHPGVNQISMAFAINCGVYSAALAISQTFYHSQPGILAFFPLSPLRHYYQLMNVCFYSWILAIIVNFGLITVSFAYRCAVITSPILSEKLYHSKILHAFFVVQSSVVFIAARYLLGTYNEARPVLQASIGHLYVTNFDSDFISCVVVELLSPLRIAVIGSAISVMIVSAVAAALIGGGRIQRAINSLQKSSRARKTHRKTLRLLILQVLFFGFLLFPLANPLMMIFMTDSYRRMLLRQASSVVRVSSINNANSKKENNSHSIFTTHAV